MSILTNPADRYVVESISSRIYNTYTEEKGAAEMKSHFNLHVNTKYRGGGLLQ